jgi:hypothetical protein
MLFHDLIRPTSVKHKTMISMHATLAMDQLNSFPSVNLVIVQWQLAGLVGLYL